MPSEAQSQEPRDRGPAPPVTRAGRSAQLAKAAATSPAPERRSRGRPRKDGSSGRSAPPTPPPPPPPPPPTPKSRKKGRSRGRAQVEDEESTDATEKKTPQKTEVTEKTTGRRRSSSRRKSNTNPEPDPEPSQDPDPTPPDPPAVPESGSEPEPAPSAEDADRTGPEAATPPASSPAAPDLSPAHSPAPMQVDCSPSAVPMETEGGGALSPCPSPPVSPCLRLEDEDALSPLFQLSLSEDSGCSPTPSLGHTTKRLKQCAFCYRGDEPPLGQGRLVVFGPTPGYIPLHILNLRASPDRDNDCHDHCYRGDQAPPTCSSPEQCDGESSLEFVEQLGPIGLPHDIDVQSLFDPTGQCCAHLQCAAWSEGVCRGEGQSLLYVDKAIDSGSKQVCAFCCRLGASLRCREAGCGRSFHFPCAAAAGAQQDWSQRHTLCTRHTHTVSSQCVLCSSGGDVGGLLMCCCCGSCYHGSCLDPPLAPSPLCRAGWQCPQCRVCQSCRLRGEDGVLLVCERCDKAYHTNCLTPPLGHTPGNGWSCKNCRICRRCGVRSSGQWANHQFLCESCDPALPCPLCDRAPDLDTPQDYLTCTCCFRCVHTECIVQAGEGRAGSEDYVCSTCRPQEEEPIPHTSIAHSPTLSPLLSPTQEPPISISQPPIPSHTEAPPISPTAHSPVQLICSEPPQSPTQTNGTVSQTSLASSQPDPTELQQSPAPSHLDPTELQQIPSPSQPDSIELQQSPAPSQPDPIELQHSPAPSHLDPAELRESPSPSHHNPSYPQQSPEPTPSDPSELQHSPAISHPEPTELEQNPEPAHPDSTELQQSPEPSDPKPTELQAIPTQSYSNQIELPQSPTASQPDSTEREQNSEPSQPEPSELQLSPAQSHPDPAELRESPSPSHPDLSELQKSPAPSHPEPTELQQSPAPLHPEPTELQQSPAPSHPEPTELQQSPAPSHPEPTELQQSPAPLHPVPTELQQSPAPAHPEPTELQQSPAPSHPEPTELQQSPALTHPEPTELQQSPAPTHPEPTEHQQSPAPSHPEPTELQQSPVPSHPEPTELQQSPAPTHPEPTELQQSPAPTHPEPTELQQSPAPSHPEPTELQQSPVPSHPEPTELQQSPAPIHPEPTELQQSPAPTHPEPTELQQSPAPSHPEPTELQQSPAPTHPEPTELQKSPAPSHPEPTELQQSPAPSHPEPTELQQSPAPSHPEPTELQQSPAPSHAEPTELQQSPAPSHAEPTELQQSPAPTHAEPTELQKSPAPTHPEPTELQQSPAPSHPEPTELQQSPAPSHPEPTELQQSPAPSHAEPTELQQSPAPSHAEPTELQQSPAPSHAEPTELQQSPAPSHAEPTELQQSPAPSHAEPTELQQSPAPSHPEPTELQQSPAPSHPEPTELQQSPAPSHPEPTELQQSPAPSHPEPTELQQSPAPLHPEPTELQQSPAPTHPEPTELQQSPAPSHPEPTELQQSPAPYQPEPTELPQSPAPSQPDSTEREQNSEQSHLDPTELQQSPTLSHSNRKKLQQSPAQTHPDPTELQLSPVPSNRDPSERQQILTRSHSNQKELQQNPTQSQPDPAELQQSPAPFHPEPSEPQQSPAQSHPDPKVSQHSPAPSHPEPSELQESLSPCSSGPTELWESSASFNPDATKLQGTHTPSEVSPVELQQSPPHVTSLQAQHTPCPVSNPSSSFTQNSTDDHLLATESPQSPTQGSPMSCGHEHSLHSPPPHTPTQAGLSPTRVQPGPAEPEQSPPPHSPVQDGTTETQLDRPCSPTNIIVITSPQQSPPRRRHSPMSHSSAHVGTSPRQNLTQDAEHTLDNESPAELQCGPAQHISTLDQGLSPVCYRSTQTARKHASLRPSSAPCSPSPSPLRATQCSLSQPASPSQAQSTQPLQLSILSSQLAKHSRVTNECTQTSTTELKSLEHSPMQLSPNLDDQTLESSPTSDLSTVPPDSNGTDGKLANQCIPIQSNPDFSSPHHSPSMPTPESLVHVSPSVEHSSLTCSPRADETEVIPPSAISICLSPSRDSPSCCTEATDGKASPTHTQNISASTSSKHTSQMSTSPASSIQACASSIPVDTSYIAAETSPSTQPASPSEVLAGSISCQDEDMEVHVDHPSHFIQSETSPKHPNSSSDSKVYGSPAHTEANGYSQMGSMHVQERASPSVCSFPELAQTQASLSPTHPGQSDPSPPCSPPQTSPDQTSPLQTSFSPPHCMLSGSSPESSSVSHSLSHSGQTSSHSASITDVTVSHSPPRSSPAGQASPFHIQSASSSPHSGPAQRQTPSLASTTYSSPAHAAATCVSPPHSPAQSIETYRSPTGSPAPDTAAQLSPTLASSNLDVDIIQSSVLPAVLHLDSGLVKPPDRIQQTSPAPAYDSHARSPNQASPSQVSQSPAGPLSTPDRSAAESQQSIASGSPLHRTPAPSVDASSTLASPVPSSPTQDTTAMPSTDHINETPSSPTPSAPSKASSVYSSPVASSVHDPGDTQVNSSLASPLRPDTSPSPGPGSPIRCEASSHSADAVSPVLATHVQSETSPGPVSPVQPGASPSRSVSSPQQHTTERASAFAEDVSMAEKQEQKTEEVEEVQGEVSQQEEEEVDDPHQRAEESPEEEEPAREQDQEEQEEISHQRAEETLEEEQPAETEGGGEQDQEEEQEEISHQRAEERLEEEEPAREQDQEEEEDQNGSSNCPSGSVLNEDPLSPPHSSAASLFLPQSAPPSPQPTTPHSALPPLQSSSPLPSPPRAGSLEASPLRTALLPSTPPSPPLEQEATCQSEAATKEVGLEDKPLSCHVTSAEDDSQSQSHFEPVAEVKEHFQAEKSEPVAAAKEQFEPTQHEHQSHAEPSERQEEPEPMREKQDAEEQDPSSSSLEDLPLEQEATCQSEAATGEAELEDKPFSCHVTSAEDEELVAEAKEPTKDEHQSHAEPTEREEEPEPEPRATATPELVAEQQPIREKQDTEEEEAREGGEQEDQSDVEQEDPVSPVLELDPSLDMEVMALLQLSSSSLTPLSRRVVGRTLRPTPPCSSRPSDDLSIRLRQSPFSTEASPETSPARAPVTPPPLSPPSPPYQESPPLSKPQTLPVTVLPLTPKIGMGKPAISKRKFSPGRARIKQGSWWSNRRAVSPPSSSQDSMGEGGWDSPKPRPPDSPLWSMRVSRGSGFPGRRRSRGGGLGGGRGGRGRSRLKTQDSLPVSPGSVYAEPFQPKEEEENSMHNTVVMFSTSDHFTLKQDMCVVCGSFGQGAEGRLLACSQCGQCYHPYCVNLKITRVVLTKGWRCLECTVCEACGEASDPGRLLLCDDCDISYHTYCLDPPLHTVPKGAWKCKWCVWCVQCGSASPGLRCDWQNNYSRCGPCASLSHCPLCQRQYSQDDLILQCQQCDRWVHAVCQGLNTEEEVEAAADEGFDCSLCRTHSRGSYGRSDSFDSPYMAQIISRIREPDTKTYTQDGVSLTESGLSHLQSLVEPLTSPRRYRRCKPKLKLRIINQNSVSVLQTPPDTDPPTQQDPSRGDVECEMKSDSSPERDHVHDDDITKEPEVTDDNKKRKRKPYRPGIGGFMVRQRGGKAGPSRIKLCRKDSVETLPGRDEDVSMETVPAADQTMEKAKKRYRKKKTKLEEEFPSYLQEAFFGRDLLDQSRQVDRKAPPEAPAASQSGAATPGLHGPSPPGLPLAAMVTNAFKKQGTLPMSEEALLDLSDVLNTDPHILATGHTAGLDISSMAADLTGSGRGQRTVQEEPLDAILSPELDKMVTDGAILSKLYNIPELEGKDVEEVFTAVLSPNSNNHQQPGQSQHAHTAAGSKGNTHHSATVFPRLPLMNGLMGAASHFSNPPMMPGVAQSPAGFRMPPPESPAPGLASANQAPAGEAEQDVMSTAQRGMLKWEKEESLGEMATVAPVLYCNTNFPQLKEQHPEWSTRVKQIAKLWRKASSQDRAPFVQKARDNRAAQRISRVQLSNDPLKRHPPSHPPSQPPSHPPSQQQQQHQLPLPPGPYDPVSMETEGAFRDPLRPRETEQEQEWKLRQIMRQKSKQLAKMEATQKLEQVKSEQRQQQMLIGRLSPDGGSRSPGTPDAARDAQSRQLLLQSSGLADDVFLRPQAPPPSGFSPLPSSPLHQPPSSPQMFSPPSSRPSSPWDPYGKVVGTPRPASSQQQRHNSLSASPAHDAFSSPAPSPDAKTSDVSRSLAPQPGLQQSRTGMMSPPSGSAPDLSSRHVGIRAAETYQRTPLNSANLRVAPSEMYSQGGLFKAPMPPQQPEVFGGPGGVRRDPSRPSDQGFPLQQSQDAPFPSSPLSGLGSPHRSPYRQDYIQPIPDPFPQHSPLTSRPSPDPYANPQTPGTPRQHSDPAYLATTYNQQAANRRPSPSHPNLDPYASNPGTPRPSGAERFPRSPGSQRGADPYAQQPSTPRPQKPPAESFTPQPAESGTFTPTLHQLQQSPGRQQQQQQQQHQQQQQQDSFPRTPGSQTPKHAGMSEESVFLGGQTQGHDAFEQGHMTSGPSLTDKTTANEMAALGVASLDGPMSMLPQLGDSEEKLRQRQRLRQLILRQQQQKSALRQEKGLQEAASASAARHWAQVDPPTAPPADLFGRPPPPYPGTVRPVGGPAGFPAEQRGFGPRELGVRAPNLRFGVPPASLQDSFLRPPQGAVPGSGISSLEGVPAQMRRPMPGEFTGIRPLPAAGTQPHMMPGLQQPFPPRSFPLQQHSIMGQPYIELRHRIPENRLRLSFPLPAGPDPRDLRPCPPVAATLGQQSVLEQLNQQQLAHAATLSHALPGADGMEEHLEDSAVKDLEDVEVKDLVDLNLNLDPEDGKEDLDLGPNDLHLDDFLLSGKFDLIAYADPELNLEDKKDMFNEELELGETAEDRKTDSHFKQEVQDGVKTEARHTAPQPGVFTTIRPPGPLVAEAAGSLQKGDDSGSGSGALPTLQTQEQAPSSGMTPRVHPPMAGGPQSVFQQRPFGPSSLFTPHPQGLPLSLQPPQPRLLLNPQTQLSQPGGSTQTQTQTVFLQNQNQSQDPDPDQDPHRALLLEEQPLLLQDLLDQERQEQQQQKQMQALIRQRPPSDAVLPNMDFDSITDPIMKAKMVALKGINKVMTQGSLGLNPMAINRFQPAPVVPAPEGAPQPPQPVGQDGKLNPLLVRPSPPSFGPGFSNESQRRQYEEWLGETQQLLQMQQRLLEEQIAAHRKTKKSLSAKQRTAKKAGRALTEEDAAQLRNITEQQGTVQKQLEQIRKQQKDHAELIDDYRTKQQRAAAALPPLSQPPLSKPPLSQPHPCAPTLPRAPNVPLGWSPGGGAPGVMGQRMPLLPPPQMPPTAPPPPAMTPGLAAPTAGFPAGPRAPPAGSNGAAGDAAPQVKFDDNNPFSEGFQERERRERLREQQERQRVQLMHEVERHRALQQRLELEQQGMLGNSMPPSGALPGARVGQTPGPPATDTLSQMPFFSSELPQDFLQSPPPPRPAFPQPAALPPGFPGGRSPLETAPSSLQARPRLPAQGAVLPTGVAAAGTPPSHPRFGHDSSSSSPSFPGASLAQLYSDIIPDDKPKKKRSRKRDGDDSGAGARTPLSSHSDDITAPPTPARSDTSCSTPTRSSVDQSDVSFSLSSSLAALAPSSELERQLSAISAAQQRGSVLGTESQRGPLSAARLEVKEEREEGGACSGGGVKMEACGGDAVFSPSPPYGGDGGKELLRHLLKDKTSPATTPSPTGQAPPTARRQLSNDSVRSEDDDHGNMVTMGSPGADLLDASGRKKTPRCKRLSRPEKDKAPPKNKRRKKEEEEKTLQSSSTSSSDPLMTHLRQLSVLPLMEPVLGVDLSLFPPYGSSSLGRDSLLSGSFGNGCLDGVTDYYSQLIYKNNLSNPPTPPASLPPTPPPVARQKLVNGFATTDELARKDISEQDVNGVKQKGEELLALNHASKTVDVPASLPTPPHNNQEELRVQDASGRDSPDGFVPSSSPESVADMEVSRYPDLSFIKLEPPSPCPSPTIPMMPCAWGKGSAVKQEVKTEPNHQFPPSCSNTDLVTIAITLNPVAAQNVAGVMAAVAELLRVPVPADYQLSGAAGTERNSLALLAGVRVPLTQSPTVSRQQRPPQCCSCCKVLLGNGVRIVKELKQEGQSRPGSSLVFCSPNCSALYTSELQSRTSGNKAAVQAVQPGAEPPGRVQHRYSSNMSSIAVHSLLHAPSSSPRNSPAASPPLSFPPASAVTMETRPRVDSLKVKVKLKPRPRALPGGEDVMSSRPGKRMKNCRWRRWSFSITLSRGPCTPNEGHAMPTEEEVDVLLKNLGACLSPDASSKDQRRCCFCNQQGDGRTDGPARLLNLDLDLWVHLNCALWSSEVYETQAGALINVELALRRSLTLRCAHCQRTGATSGCNRLRCTNTYHFSCALQAHCTFFKDKTMLCPLHKPRTVPLSGDRSSSCSPSSAQSPAPDPAAAAFCDPYDCELRCFSVFRRVFVQRDEARQIAGVVQRGERQHTFRVGSLLFRAIGRLLPHQMKAFHNQAAIFPIGYHANRIYWSMRHSNRRCKYLCCIEEAEGRPLFRVKVVEKGYDDVVLTGPSPKAVWDQILEPVSQLRSSSGTLKLFPVYLKGEDLFGLTTSAVTRIIESLPGVETCERYIFRYGRNPLMEWPLAFNPSGSARSEPKACQTKRPTLLTSIAPRCQGSVGSIVGVVPGVIALSPGESVAGAHQGRHSKSAQYRRMKAEWKTNVYLARSRIQGLGLYAARDIEKCTMVIEYIGTIIRSEVANRKERLYESQNRGVYMFRIDNDFVIDATITGGPARYINHSCSPNCITEVVTVEKENKIIISSCRRIQRGEELSYDYKFDLEDDQHKIPCHCGAVNCRKWMN